VTRTRTKAIPRILLLSSFLLVAALLGILGSLGLLRHSRSPGAEERTARHAVEGHSATAPDSERTASHAEASDVGPPACSTRAQGMVSGRVLVAGAPPGVRLPLALLDRNLDLPGSMLSRSPYHAVEPGVTRVVAARRLTSTYPDGTFCFNSLPHEWAGSLLLPSGYRQLEIPGRTTGYGIALSRPTRDLQVNIEIAQPITGSLIEAGSSRPLADLPLVLDFRSTKTAREQHQYGRTDEDGSFVIAGTIDLSGQLRLRVSADDGRFSLERNVDASAWKTDPNMPLELGELRLQARRSYQLTIVAPDGFPIDDARIRPFAPVDFARLETGGVEFYPNDGETPPETLLLRDGFWPTLARFERGTSALTVEMPRANELTLQLRSSDGSPLEPGWSIEFDVEGPNSAVWDSGRGEFVEMADDIVNKGKDVRLSWLPQEAQVDESGRAVLRAVRPNARIEVVPSHARAEGVEALELPALTAQQKRSDQVMVPSLLPAGELTIDLVAKDGTPVEGADVYTQRNAYPGVSPPRAVSPATGRVTLKDLDGSRATIQIDHPDFVPIQRELDFNTPGTATRIELMRAVPFELIATTARGLPFACNEVFLESAENVPELPVLPFRRAREIAPGRFLFRRLPPGTVRIRCSSEEIEFDTRDGTGYLTAR